VDAVFVHDDPYSSMMYTDTSTYLPDDILVKVDRASMAVGLEARVPMLDHRVLEFAWQLPLHLKVRGRTKKWLLKQVLRKYLPESLLARPKMGFGVPVGEWIRGPLREWAESLLGEDRLRGEGFLNPKFAREQWLCHLAGDSAGSDSLWHVLAFQSWLGSVASH
jgi:asparagine synthase (glutamine-hydrolysing)